jgi:hypothetical protein
MRAMFDSVRDAAAAALGAGATTVGGSVVGAPGWLIGLGQAVVVVFFTLRGIDRRMKALKDEQDEIRGQLHTLKGRVDALCGNKAA